jgi:hypothetical protein
VKKSGGNDSLLHNLYTPSKGRRDRLTGDWRGFVWPNSVPGVPIEIPVKLLFDARKKIVTGEMSFASWDKKRGPVENYLVGGFKNDGFMEFAYAKKEDGVIGWGSLLLELSPDGKSIKGRAVGVSSHTGLPFYSTLRLIKGKQSDSTSFSILKTNKPIVFIGHGRSQAWKTLKNYLVKKGYRVETFESGARAGRTINDVLAGMMAETAFAILIMSGEDKMKSGTLRARQNVVHEIGLFQGKLGIKRAVILLETGVEDFSNIRGITYIPFRKTKINEIFAPILAALDREFPKR